MSDISLRFDGLLLFATVSLGALAYLLIALGAAAVALSRRKPAPRWWSAARRSGLLALATLALAALLFFWIDRLGSNVGGPDWLDLAAAPYLALFAAGCWFLARKPRRP